MERRGSRNPSKKKGNALNAFLPFPENGEGKTERFGTLLELELSEQEQDFFVKVVVEGRVEWYGTQTHSRLLLTLPFRDNICLVIPAVDYSHWNVEESVILGTGTSGIMIYGLLGLRKWGNSISFFSNNNNNSGTPLPTASILSPMSTLTRSFSTPQMFQNVVGVN